MIRKYHNHLPQHSEEKSQNTNSHKTSGRQFKQSNKLSLQDDCRTRKDIKYYLTKQVSNKQCEQQWTINQQQSHRLKNW